MEGGNDKTKKKTNSKSTSSKKTRSVRKSVDVSNEQLLEEILNKKKEKKTTKSSSKKTTTSKSTKTSTTKRNNKLKDTSNDLLYEQIKQKKKTKKSSTKTIFEAELEYEKEEAKLREKDKLAKEKNKKKEETNEVYYKGLTVGDLEDSLDIDESDYNEEKEESVSEFKNIEKEEKIEEVIHEIVEEPKVEETKVDEESYNSLEQSVIRKREQKDDFVEFLTEIENDKLLRDIKAALANNNVEYIKPGYEQSKEEALKKIDNEINERIKNNANKVTTSKVNYRFKKRLLLIGICIALLILLVFVVMACVKSFSADKQKVGIYDQIANKIEADKLEQEMFAKYNDCLKRPIDEFDSSDSINKYVEELNQYFYSTYKISVMYNDLEIGYSYGYNTDKTYYAASTIKSLGAIYLYEKALNGEVNLDDTVIYSKKHRLGASAFMKNVSYGTKVSLRDLVRYSITASDNTAHKMIVDYIGIYNLIEYGKSLGATLTHLGGDLFGYINVTDAMIYMKKLNQLINDGGDLGQELKSYFVNDDQNGLKLDDLEISAAHKYGQYQGIYHDIGIVYAEHPYVVTILTQHGKGDFVNIIRDINGRIYQLHELYVNNRITYCETLIYSK